MIPALFLLLAPHEPLAAPSGGYVEARTASVFAGACHFGGEATLGGREALVAWHVEHGGYEGVDLAGTSIAALVVSDANLADGAPRRSIVYVDPALEATRAVALVRWLGATRADLLGTVERIDVRPLRVSVGDDAYSARAAGVFELAGSTMPDRACCRMPFSVWYAPLEKRLEARTVGLDEVFDVREPSLDAAWSRPRENAAFRGWFGG